MGGNRRCLRSVWKANPQAAPGAWLDADVSVRALGSRSSVHFNAGERRKRTVLAVNRDFGPGVWNFDLAAHEEALADRVQISYY